MGLRIRKSIKLLPGVKINLSKGGASVSLGKRGMSYNIGKKGSRTTIGIPGSGISYTSYSRKEGANDNGKQSGVGKILWLLFVLGVMAVAAYYNL